MEKRRVERFVEGVTVVLCVTNFTKSVHSYSHLRGDEPTRTLSRPRLRDELAARPHTPPWQSPP